MRIPTLRRALALTAAGATAALVLAGCAGGTQEQAADTEAPLYEALPQDIKDAGKIVVGGDIAYAPMEYYDEDGTTILGFDKELTDLLSEQLGVPFEWNNVVFDSLITQLNSGRIDIIVSGMSDNEERQQEIDFVDYYMAGAVLLVPKGNPEGLSGIADLCGMTIAVQRGTVQEGYAQEQSAQCETDGQQPIEILSFDRETEAMLQIKNGRAVAGMQDYPVAAYNARVSGDGEDFEVVGDQVQAGPMGIGVAKEDTELRDAIQQAVQAVIDNGEYGELIEKYETPLGAVDEATINGG
ncbi:ABC transporter substrate-binding protein [Microbacterium sp. Marseille-Q6965]|uniref:ABC transporter substrate-binding protein n=1 Tax=Microbacterium sp. Marseille-Q6965 TaxID=2965072 RepID=UPI0021B7497C|nr:ABC transporter substrate-binding protein [Microbacterium sp. Marseille-Q6965]